MNPIYDNMKHHIKVWGEWRFPTTTLSSRVCIFDANDTNDAPNAAFLEMVEYQEGVLDHFDWIFMSYVRIDDDGEEIEEMMRSWCPTDGIVESPSSHYLSPKN